ncbi:hypothetical protein JXB27_02950 [Candidatus Woesearchaeota archaeon]|nr:hypothetical protein [Candidatus Woesearchaeota archaeon]
MNDNSAKKTQTQNWEDILRGVVRSNPVLDPTEPQSPKEITRKYLNRAQMMSLVGDRNYRIITVWQKEFDEHKPITYVQNIEELDQMSDRILWYKK